MVSSPFHLPLPKDTPIMATSASATNDTVLVTGGSSFLGGYCILKLLEKGQYSIRTTVRSLTRVEETRSNLRHGGATEEQVASIEILVADLMTDDEEIWQKACTSVRYVLHVAGMIPTGKEKRLDELLEPLRQGVLKVLRASKAAGVEKVVFTSSIATLAHGHGTRDKTEPFTEEDWTDLSGSKETVHIYPRAKTLTEQAAWEYVNEGEGKGMRLSVICPAAMYGPSLNKDYRASLKLILILCGGTPGMPYYGTGMVCSRPETVQLQTIADPLCLARWTLEMLPNCTCGRWKALQPTDSDTWPLQAAKTAIRKMSVTLSISRLPQTSFAMACLQRLRRRSPRE